MGKDEEGGSLSAGNRQFWALRADNNSFYRVNAALLAENSLCLVYAADDAKTRERVNRAKAQEIADEFEHTIYSLITANFGPPSDVDGNGKIIILLLDIQDGYSSSSPSYVAGYFAGYFALSGYGYAYTNRADMVFMDTWPLSPGSEPFNSTLAHEFQHLVNYNHHYINYNQTPGGTRGESDLWLNEGLSSAAEYLYTKAKHPETPHVTGKIDYYKDDLYGDIRKGGNFFTWTPSWLQNPYTSYSTVYLFFQWLRIHAGTQVVYQKISASPYKDYRAITDAVSLYPILGSDWPAILNNWFIANALCNSASVHGYGADSSIIGTLQPDGWRTSLGSSWELLPGEGIYVPKSGPYTNGSPPANIMYTGLNTSGKTVDSTGSSYEGDVLLAVNTSTNISNPAVIDTPIPTSSHALPQAQASRVRGGAASLLQTAPVPREPLPVDRVFRVGN